MNKTKPTLAQQTYEKVCAIETILNSPAGRQQPARVRAPPSIWQRLAPRCLSRSSDWRTLLTTSLVSTRADLLYGIPGLPILMSYCPEQVMDIGEESYLVGPMVFFRIDRDGYTVSLQVADLYQLAEFLEEHSVILMQGGESFIAIRLD